MNKFLLIFILFSGISQAQDIKVPNQKLDEIAPLKSELNTLDLTIKILKQDFVKMEGAQQELNTNLERNIVIQSEIQKSTKRLIALVNSNNKELEPFNVKLLQPTNYYIYLLPIITICIVLASTVVSLRTIRIKSQESLDALTDSNKNQLILSQSNNEAERLRSQEAILSESRQKWINTLREDLALLISNLTLFFSASKDNKKDLFPLIWNEYYKIQLLLNPNEELHKNLKAELGNAISISTGTTGTTVTEFTSKTNEILDLSKVILKLEWDRVKSFE